MSVSTSTIALIFENVAFKHDDTTITKTTVQLLAEYIRLFVHEAVVRANEERVAEGALDTVDGIDNVAEPDVGDDEDPPVDLATQYGTQAPAQLLDTRHLAKVAGVLVLDF